MSFGSLHRNLHFALLVSVWKEGEEEIPQKYSHTLDFDVSPPVFASCSEATGKGQILIETVMLR